MTQFVSYAQNFEDVMLRRALRDVEQGFYIDVGANDPKNWGGFGIKNPRFRAPKPFDFGNGRTTSRAQNERRTRVTTR